MEKNPERMRFSIDKVSRKEKADEFWNELENLLRENEIPRESRPAAVQYN